VLPTHWLENSVRGHTSLESLPICKYSFVFFAHWSWALPPGGQWVGRKRAPPTGGRWEGAKGPLPPGVGGRAPTGSQLDCHNCISP
jgi:hypothetical protein